MGVISTERYLCTMRRSVTLPELKQGFEIKVQQE